MLRSELVWPVPGRMGRVCIMAAAAYLSAESPSPPDESSPLLARPPHAVTATDAPAEVAELQQEIELLRAKVDAHPDVKRFAVENIRLSEVRAVGGAVGGAVPDACLLAAWRLRRCYGRSSPRRLPGQDRGTTGCCLLPLNPQSPQPSNNYAPFQIQPLLWRAGGEEVRGHCAAGGAGGPAR